MPAEPPQNGNRTRRGEARRKEILLAARRVFSTKGFEASSMAEIAAEVGIVEGAIYKHFASKRELLFEATQNLYEPQIESARRQLKGIRGTRNRLRFVIAHQLQSFVDNPGLCNVIIHEIRPKNDYYGSIVRRLNREMTSLVVGIVEEAAASGELRPGVRPTLVRDVVFGGIEHLAWKTLIGRETLEVETQADALADLIMLGIEHHAGGDADDELARLRAQVDRLEALIDKLAGSPVQRGASTRTRRRR